jgi:hypothetical protein
VGLQVRFIPFGELVDWAEAFDPDNFQVQSFVDEVAALGGAASSASVLEAATIPLEEVGQRATTVGKHPDPRCSTHV